MRNEEEEVKSETSLGEARLDLEIEDKWNAGKIVQEITRIQTEVEVA